MGSELWLAAHFLWVYVVGPLMAQRKAIFLGGLG